MSMFNLENLAADLMRVQEKAKIRLSGKVIVH